MVNQKSRVFHPRPEHSSRPGTIASFFSRRALRVNNSTLLLSAVRSTHVRRAVSPTHPTDLTQSWRMLAHSPGTPRMSDQRFNSWIIRSRNLLIVALRCANMKLAHEVKCEINS